MFTLFSIVARLVMAYLHVCSTPWEGDEYHEGDKAFWTMSYADR
jgi:hypothetical protein